MKHFLYPGQRFRFIPFEEFGRKLPNVVHRCAYDADRLLIPDAFNVKTAASYEDMVTQGGGPHDGHRVSLRFKGDIFSIAWEVSEVELGGGGTGHGPHDIYPNGNQVKAKGPNDLTLHFPQSGCFSGMVPPSYIELLNAAEFPDRPMKWKRVLVPA